MLNFRWLKIYLSRRFPVTPQVPHEIVNVLLFVQLFFHTSRRDLSRRFVVWKRRNFVPNKRRIALNLFLQMNQPDLLINCCYKRTNTVLLNQSWILIAVSTLTTVLVQKIVYRRYSWKQRRQTETGGIMGNERVRENLALYVTGNLVSQGIFSQCHHKTIYRK